jgi:hypothetical protein
MISGTDAYGSWLDTGCSTQPAARPNTEVETHNASEIDTGSKLTIAQVIASHVPHRAALSPR